MSLADRIIYVREKVLGLSQEALASRLGVKRGAVGNWELGGGVSNNHLKAIASLAKASLDWLINGIGERPRPGLNSETHDFIASVLVREAESHHLDPRALSASMLAQAIAKAIAERRIEPEAHDRHRRRSSVLPVARSKSKTPNPPKIS